MKSSIALPLNVSWNFSVRSLPLFYAFPYREHVQINDMLVQYIISGQVFQGRFGDIPKSFIFFIKYDSAKQLRSKGLANSIKLFFYANKITLRILSPKATGPPSGTSGGPTEGFDKTKRSCASSAAAGRAQARGAREGLLGRLRVVSRFEKGHEIAAWNADQALFEKLAKL